MLMAFILFLGINSIQSASFENLAFEMPNNIKWNITVHEIGFEPCSGGGNRMYAVITVQNDNGDTAWEGTIYSGCNFRQEPGGPVLWEPEAMELFKRYPGLEQLILEHIEF